MGPRLQSLQMVWFLPVLIFLQLHIGRNGSASYPCLYKRACVKEIFTVNGDGTLPREGNNTFLLLIHTTRKWYVP